MDELLVKLKQHDIGCHIGTKFVGALCYADDLVIMCPTSRGLQKMINVCVDFASEYDVVFNPGKTSCMMFGMKTVPNTISMYLGQEKLQWANSIKHLGNMVSTDLKDDLDVQFKRGNFYMSVNGLCAKFKSVLSNNVIASKLFQTYCCSFYGSQLWDLSGSSLDNMCIAWNKSVRRIFGNIMNSENAVMKLLALNAHFSNTPIGLNRKYINIYRKNILNDGQNSQIGLLISLLNVRDQHWHIPQFQLSEVVDMIEHICTS